MEEKTWAGQGAAWKEIAVLIRNRGQKTSRGDVTVGAGAGGRRQGAGIGLADRRETCGVQRLVTTIDYCSRNTNGLEKRGQDRP